MAVAIAFLTVVLVWSSTPLGIVWSSETIQPSLALLLRMLIAWVLGVIIVLIFRIRVPVHKHAIILYLYSSIGIAGGMWCSYQASQSIPSGLMSLFFGLSPVLAGLFAQKILNDPPFSFMKKVALLVAFSGLSIVCFSKLNAQAAQWSGIVYVFIAVNLFSLSGVMIKRVNVSIHPIATTVGTLTVSFPFFILFWLLEGAHFTPAEWQAKSIYAVMFLGVFGSLIGFVAYFYILQHLKVSTVALTTLITPVLAIFIGIQLNNESISASLAIGACLIIFGLTAYQFGERWTSKFKVHV